MDTIDEHSRYCTQLRLGVPGHGSRMYARHEGLDAHRSGARVSSAKVEPKMELAIGSWQTCISEHEYVGAALATKLWHGPLSVMWYVHVGDSRTDAVIRVAPGAATNLT